MADNEEKLNYNEDESKLIAKDIWKEEIPAVIEEETTLVSGLNKIFQSLFNRIKKVRTTFLERKILTGNGLSGGGNLSTDRTLSVKRKDTSINVENTVISVNRSNEYNTTSASEDVLLTQLGGKSLYNRVVANENAISNNSDRIESSIEDRRIILRGKTSYTLRREEWQKLYLLKNIYKSKGYIINGEIVDGDSVGISLKWGGAGHGTYHIVINIRTNRHLPNFTIQNILMPTRRKPNISVNLRTGTISLTDCVPYFIYTLERY